MTAPVWTVGQACVVYGDRLGPVLTSIKKVGRKYVYTANGCQFDKITGAETESWGYSRHLATPEQHAEVIRRQGITSALRDRHGITLRAERSYSTDGLTAALAVLDIDLERNTNG